MQTDVQYWVTPGIILEKVQDGALKDVARGKTVHIHFHKSGDDCNASCYIIKP